MIELKLAEDEFNNNNINTAFPNKKKYSLGLGEASLK